MNYALEFLTQVSEGMDRKKEENSNYYKLITIKNEVSGLPVS